MRGVRVGVCCLGAFLLLGTAGCQLPVSEAGRQENLLTKVGLWSNQPDLKPPPHPDEFVPPPNDLRFTAPPVFPKEAQRDFQKSLDNPNGLDQPGKQGPRFGAGPGMGG
jgi:hypothetical protein